LATAIDDPIAAGRDAAQRHAWGDAYRLLATADADGGLAPSDLEDLANSAWWTGRLDEAIAARERAYAGHVAAGNGRRAARVALVLAEDAVNRSAMSVAAGWLGRAERLLEHEDEGVEHAHLAYVRGFIAVLSGALDRALEETQIAVDLARRFGDRSLEAVALTWHGKALLHKGDVTAGLALLDETTAAAISGELTPLATAEVYCCTISSCQRLGDVARAAEWTEAANRWCHRLEVSGFPGACRVHRAEIMRLRGEWPEAEQQALAACEELHDFNRWVTAFGFYEVAEIRRRRGDFAAAEETFSKVNELGGDVQPGLALLRLAQGKVEAALAGMRRTLGDSEDPLTRARLLPAQVEVAIAAGDIEAAKAAAHELEEISDLYRVGDERTPAFEANLLLAWGRIHLAEGDWDTAERSLRRAWKEWRAIGAPYETAQARMLLGTAYRRDGDEDGAQAEFEAALAAFEELGAELDAERVNELLGRTEALRTFVFTDIVDSTRLVEALGDQKWRKLLGWHDRTVRELIEASGGEVIKNTGDGFFAAFERPAAAAEAAVAIQRALDSYEGVAPDVRIGLHVGTAFEREGEDLGGEAVHAAARIAALGGPGDILGSRETFADGAARFRVSEPRSVELKGVSQPVEVVSIDWR
jgi:class 3 adenylate cyclase